MKKKKLYAKAIKWMAHVPFGYIETPLVSFLFDVPEHQVKTDCLLARSKLKVNKRGVCLSKLTDEAESLGREPDDLISDCWNMSPEVENKYNASKISLPDCEMYPSSDEDVTSDILHTDKGPVEVPIEPGGHGRLASQMPLAKPRQYSDDEVETLPELSPQEKAAQKAKILELHAKHAYWAYLGGHPMFTLNSKTSDDPSCVGAKTWQEAVKCLEAQLRVQKTPVNSESLKIHSDVLPAMKEDENPVSPTTKV